jgi:hypothetical protein
MTDSKVTGEYVQVEGDRYYKISNYDQMEPFFMSLVSHSDHWMFISSSGGLSAGRKDEDNALFPYYTDDKITKDSNITGSKTGILVQVNGKWQFWEPFGHHYAGVYRIERNLYKHHAGNQIIFESLNHDLNVGFRYGWSFSGKYGFVRTARVINLSSKSQSVRILDGIQNILPYGVSSNLQNIRSNLVDAYKRSELDAETGLGVFALSAMIVDRAEPSEGLSATTVCAISGFKTCLLSSKQWERFKYKGEVTQETDVKGMPGAYFVFGEISMAANNHHEWLMLAEVNQSRAQVENLRLFLDSKSTDELHETINEDIAMGTKALKGLVGKSDGLQLTGDDLSANRHYANVLFNVMRGGIFEDQYEVYAGDLRSYVKQVNRDVFQSNESFLKGLPDQLRSDHLIQQAFKEGDVDLLRICYEYLPLSFSRRHGDPSRPWNRFSITLKNPDGSKSRNYEGNWRDIFQNWEALAFSYPRFVYGMIFKFLDASTIDGYNPYRISRTGIDWEVIEPDDPLSYIGYWGDHQIIYLLKLLEMAEDHDPGFMDRWLNECWFVYADVPYRIKPYRDLVRDPQDTIDFNEEMDVLSHNRSARLGADGKLIHDGNGKIMHASFMEKILVTWLTKMYNFIPDAGIWLNTQRPEWNDANNALVGNGTSMVTLYYMRRFARFFEKWFDHHAPDSIDLPVELAELMSGIMKTLLDHNKDLESGFTNQTRRKFVDALGQYGEAYREKAYAGLSNQRTKISASEVQKQFQLAIEYINQTTAGNIREDGLYHAYNIVDFEGDEVRVKHLYEMLEGQVALLSSGFADGSASLQLLNDLKSSAMFREDQYSYMLYPNRDIPGFFNKNLIPSAFINKSELISKMVENKDFRLIEIDDEGKGFFNGSIHNASDIENILDEIIIDYGKDLINKEREAFLDVFEEMFDHQSFTGRSGTFFAFEGLGSIYWHMVSKLLLATQETIRKNRGMLDDKLKEGLIGHYYEIRAGIGINKSPDLYGAFPTDPYSHTPFHRGAQQPGMTGQVKEDIISRWAELGVEVKDGKISFDPWFINPDEWLNDADSFEYLNVRNDWKTVDIEANQLVFTYCQVPVVYRKADKNRIEIRSENGSIEIMEGNELPVETSSRIFDRDGSIALLYVDVAH